MWSYYMRLGCAFIVLLLVWNPTPPPWRPSWYTTPIGCVIKCWRIGTLETSPMQSTHTNCEGCVVVLFASRLFYYNTLLHFWCQPSRKVSKHRVTGTPFLAGLHCRDVLRNLRFKRQRQEEKKPSENPTFRSSPRGVEGFQRSGRPPLIVWAADTNASHNALV